MTNKIAVLHCAETIKGGIATYLRELLPLQMLEFGHEQVAVIVPASQAKELGFPVGIRVIHVDDSGGRIKTSVALALKVKEFCKLSKPRVIHIHSTFAGVVLRPLIPFFSNGSRVVYCSHGWAVDRPMSALGRWSVKFIERYLSHLTSAVVCISDHDYRTGISIGICPKVLFVIKNGISVVSPKKADVDIEWPSDRSVVRLLFVGRFDRQKGVDVLVEALNVLGSDVYAVLAGGSVLSDSESIVLPANAKGVGWVGPNVLETLFQSADLLVVPSRWEGFGLTAIEGMRAGLAVVGARVGGLAEVVEDGVTGLLVESGSSEALVKAIKALNRARIEEMGRAGRLRFEELFTIDRVHRELLAIYK